MPLTISPASRRLPHSLSEVSEVDRARPPVSCRLRPRGDAYGHEEVWDFYTKGEGYEVIEREDGLVDLLEVAPRSTSPSPRGGPKSKGNESLCEGEGLCRKPGGLSLGDLGRL